MNTREKFYKKNWFIYLMLFVFPPVGIILLWIFNRKSTKAKGILTAVSAIWLVIALLSGNSPDNTNETTTLAENESTIENSIEGNSTTDSSIIESIETTSSQESIETESPETESIPESTEDIQVEQELISELKSESIPLSETTQTSESTMPNANLTATQPASEELTSTQENTITPPQSEPIYVWLSETGDKYHSTNRCGKMNPEKAVQVTLDEAIRDGKEQCTKCW